MDIHTVGNSIIKNMCQQNNDIIVTIEKLIHNVYRARSVDPWQNAETMDNHYDNLFRSNLSGWPFRKLTDLEHGSSSVMAFLLHPGHYIGVPTRDGMEVLIRQLGGKCYHAIVEISHIGPFARIRFTREVIDSLTGRIIYDEKEIPWRVEDTEFTSTLRGLLSVEGIDILPQEILTRTVPNLELNVTREGKVTIYHCLFDEE